ncbi:PREDICTED: cytokine receptor-like factor 2 [Buceros rhinoceros silvestris]|nr:PREDICTED: cytokine receptor-like factor 2 [Buceros rhinoceros silvestris]
MRHIFQACSMIFTLGNLASQSQSSGWKDAISTKIINFNNEKMQITWAARELFPGENVSFSYTFDEVKHKVWKPCPTYLLDQDYNSGCLFKTEGPTLAISIRNGNGSEQLFSKRLKSDFYIKPNRPENVTFFWKENTVTVSCNKPERAVKCLRLELQYKSKFDKEWQSRTSKCCSVGEQGFDPRKCYSFRVRLKRLVPYCNVVNYSSDWEAETFWMNGTLLGNSGATFLCCPNTNGKVMMAKEAENIQQIDVALLWPIFSYQRKFMWMSDRSCLTSVHFVPISP